MAELGTLTSPHHKLAPEAGSSPPSPIQQKPYKPITSLISKAAFFLIFAAFLPLFPSQAPEFVNQTLLTRSWELLHLFLVGVAISYGLFSHRNADAAAEKEALHRADTPQSYLAQLLQVSPVFDDEEPEIPSGPDENKLQMWNSRYHREEPTVVVAPESPGNGGSVGRRLLLPVRSLRTRVPDAESRGKKDEHVTPLIAGVGSRSFPRRRAEDRNDGEAASLDPPAQKKELAGDPVVLPSPIPWRSRSGRMEVKDETSAAAPSSHSLPTHSTIRTPSFRSPPSRPNSATPSRRKRSPSPSVSPEPRTTAGEGPGKKKTLYKAPPPPPPPPPPPLGHKHPNPQPDEKEAHGSFRGELKNSNGRNGGRDDDRGWSSDLGSPRQSRFHTRARSHAEGYYSVGRSVRTVRPREVSEDAMPDGATLSTASLVHKHRIEKKKKNEVEGEVVTASDDSNSDGSGEAFDMDELPSATATGADAEEENEVDKKADEFIAKFREQIRLQRIESIKTTAGSHGLRKPDK